MPSARTPSAPGADTPAKAIVGHPVDLARRGRRRRPSCRTALDASIAPSPVRTSSAPRERPAQIHRAITKPIPGSSWPPANATSPPPSPPAAPRPGRSRIEPPGRARRSRRGVARFRSSVATISGVAPFCGPKRPTHPGGHTRDYRRRTRPRRSRSFRRSLRLDASIRASLASGPPPGASRAVCVQKAVAEGLRRTRAAVVGGAAADAQDHAPRPASIAARSNSPVPQASSSRDSDVRAERCAWPEAAAISMTAVRRRPACRRGGNGQTEWSRHDRMADLPPVAATSASTVPSPPSAIGEFIDDGVRVGRQHALLQVCTASVADRLPRNLSGATTTQQRRFILRHGSNTFRLTSRPVQRYRAAGGEAK